MSDLISRKKVIDILEKEKSLKCGYDAGIAIFSIEKRIRELPTAYDIDKIVEELESFAKLAEDRWKNGTSKHAYQEHKCLVKAIEIVKQDGAGTETETIRDKAVKWNNNSSKRVPYEFIDYVEGKREIGVSNNVCEWKSTSDGEFIQNPHTKRLYSNEPSMKNVYCNTCGKKIKVMEEIDEKI